MARDLRTELKNAALAEAYSQELMELSASAEEDITLEGLFSSLDQHSQQEEMALDLQEVE